jgi:hypothetical protein
MGMIFLGQAHGLFQNRVRQTALDLNDNRFVVLVRDNHTLQNALRHFRRP